MGPMEKWGTGMGGKSPPKQGVFEVAGTRSEEHSPPLPRRAVKQAGLTRLSPAHSGL